MLFDEMPDLPEGFDGEVRLFPLPDLVCFPFALLPLHFFESRYCEMFEDVLEGDRLICMATLEPGYQTDYYSRPPVSPFVCIGRLATHNRRVDGTYDCMLVGLWRARIQSEISPVRSYRRAQVEVLSEDIIGKTEQDRSAHGDFVEQVIRLVPSTEELVETFTTGKVSLNGLTDLLAFHLPFDRQVKLALLEELNAVKRAELLLEHLPNLPAQPPSDDVDDDDDPLPFSGN